MADTAVRVPLTVRLKPEDKTYFSDLTERSGLEPSIAARQILELVIQRMRVEPNFIEALHTLDSALREPKAA